MGFSIPRPEGRGYGHVLLGTCHVLQGVTRDLKQYFQGFQPLQRLSARVFDTMVQSLSINRRLGLRVSANMTRYEKMARSSRGV